MSHEHGDMWTCGRCGRKEFTERKNPQHKERPPEWRKMSLHDVPNVMASPIDDELQVDPTVKDLCGDCVGIVLKVWDGEARVEIRKLAG